MSVVVTKGDQYQVREKAPNSAADRYEQSNRCICLCESSFYVRPCVPVHLCSVLNSNASFGYLVANLTALAQQNQLQQTVHLVQFVISETQLIWQLDTMKKV